MRKIEQLIDPILDTRELIKRVWVILWIILFILDILKFSFGIWYPIIVENKNLLQFFNFIDNHKILKTVFNFLLYTINLNITFLILIIHNNFRNKLLFLGFNVIVLGMFIIKFFDRKIGSIIELSIILMAIIFNLKNKTFNKKIFNIIYPLLATLMMNLYQLGMVFARDITEVIDTLPTSIMYILQIDYYIFLLIMLIGVNMGILGFGYLWSYELTRLKALKEKELKKKKPRKKYLEEIDKAILAKQKEQC